MTNREHGKSPPGTKQQPQAGQKHKGATSTHPTARSTEKRSGIIVSIYDQYPDNGLKSRIALWLSREHWTLEQAAMLFSDIAPDLAIFDQKSRRLVSCVSLSNELYGDDPELARKVHDCDEMDGVDADGEDDRTERPIKPIADQFADMVGDLRASLLAKTVRESMPPVEWVRYAEERRIKLPWLGWAKARLTLFPWLAEAAPAHSVPPRTGDRNRELQQAANDLADRWKKEGRKDITKRDIARSLATEAWREMTADRIERIIRVKW